MVFLSVSHDGLTSGAQLCLQVNGQNVVKVGHRQVVNMIRQGGNSLMVKVVMVTRNPDMEEGSRKKSRSVILTLSRMWFVDARLNVSSLFHSSSTAEQETQHSSDRAAVQINDFRAGGDG